MLFLKIMWGRKKIVIEHICAWRWNLFSILLLVLLEKPKVRVSCRAAHSGAGRNVGFTLSFPDSHLNPDLSFQAWRSYLQPHPAAFFVLFLLVEREFSELLPEASCRVEGAFDWPLLSCGYIYLPHHWWGNKQSKESLTQTESPLRVLTSSISVRVLCTKCFTGEVQSVGVLGCVELHHTSLVSVVALFDLSACHRAGCTGINLTGTFTKTD